MLHQAGVLILSMNLQLIWKSWQFLRN